MEISQHHKKFLTLIREIAYPSQWDNDAFSDFLQLSTIALANRYYKNEEMENEYLQIVKKYDKDKLSKFAELLAITTIALNEKHQDFLGECFMQSNMGNKHRGQFFTPYHISSFMAQINLGDSKDIENGIKNKGYFKMNEPACGSGGMVIACDEVIKNAGLKDSEVMCVQAQDIDYNCFMMTFIQLSLLDIPARVVLGNTLTLEESKELYTFAFVRDDWFDRFFKNETKEKVANNPLYNEELLETFKKGILF